MNVTLGLIEVSGQDAAKFLQGQVTCDVREVTEQKSSLGAHCDAKGRVQFTFRLFKYQDCYYLRLPQSLIAHALALLQKYLIFSKTKLTVYEGELTNRFAPDENWQMQDIETGVATITPETVGLFTPHDINYHLINAVSFNKGCYTGQEIVARMHYLGKPKQSLYRFAIQSPVIPMPGMKLQGSNQQVVGVVVNVAKDIKKGTQILAVIQDAGLRQAIYLNQTPYLLTQLDLTYTNDSV